MIIVLSYAAPLDDAKKHAMQYYHLATPGIPLTACGSNPLVYGMEWPSQKYRI